MSILARWEWRAFGQDVDAARPVFASLRPQPAEESDETYLLSRTGDASVKVRGGGLDVKQLETVRDDGLEQWRPVMKTTFPLIASDTRFVLGVLRAAGRRRRGARSADELAAASPDLVAVRVHKRRERYVVGTCLAELTRIKTSRGATETVAIESEDPALLAATLRELGLDSRRNVCMARGLKTLAGFGARRFAVIDVGTNSVKLHVGERSADGGWRAIADQAEVTRLGEGLVRRGRLGAAPIERTVHAIATMAAAARADGAEGIEAVGTAALRLAPNAGELLAATRARCGVHVEVMPADDEARLAYVAATSSLPLPPGALVVFDTGGGSSQFTFGDDHGVQERFSVNVGAARFTERYALDRAAPRAVLEAALAAITADLVRLEARGIPDAIVAMGGAVTNLAAVKHGLTSYDRDVVHGTVLDRDEIDRQIELYRARPALRRRQIAGLQPSRADVILAGACIVRTVLAMLRCDTLTVCDRGLRHGVLAERFRLGPPRPAPVSSRAGVELRGSGRARGAAEPSEPVPRR
jgi:exopolyphosphatase/guanosine-5'-triphosphate,3'-diphosphate pyrophosphatase